MSQQQSIENLQQHIEALIFTAEQPVTVPEIKSCLDRIFETDIEQGAILKAIEQLIKKYEDDGFPFEVIESGGGYQFLTKKIYFDTAAALRKQKSNKRLSKAMLETLAIIAYKQPVTKLEVDKIRGVNSDYVVRKLLEKELAIIAGKANSPGKPILYRTSELFLDYFGINSLDDLPELKDLEPEQPELFTENMNKLKERSEED